MAIALQPDAVAEQRDAFLERMIGSLSGAFDMVTIYMGDRLGFYRALSNGIPMTPSDLARAAGANERYAREWLEQQAVSGIVEAVRDNGEWQFRLPEAHAEVLTDTESLNYLAPLARVFIGACRPLDRILECIRTGEGITFEDYGEDLREGQGDINRTMFLQQLGQEWLPVMRDVHESLMQKPRAKIADVGCGLGWSSIGMARCYPSAQVDGYDMDRPSIDRANDILRHEGLSDRVSFHCVDVGKVNLDGHYDLVTAFECIHDMPDPVSVLRTMKRLAGDDGAVLIGDERVREEFSPEQDPVEQMMYGWSVLCCLPFGMSEQPSAATGTVMRPGTLEAYAREAGFSNVEILPIDNLFFRFYRLYP